jgi:hypothetical protein
MKVIDEKKYNYIVLSDDKNWYLTFLSGGPVEIDYCICLTESEIKDIQNGLEVKKIIQKLQGDRDQLIKRRILPSIWS